MKQRHLRSLLGVVACALPPLVYYWGLDNPFVFDDRDTVLLNPSLVDPRDFLAALLHNSARPAVNFSYAIDRALWGISSFGFHVTNLLLHLVVVGLFYGWCTRALADGFRTGADENTSGARSDADEAPKIEWPAFLAAAVFALHPLMAAATGYVSARSELLAALGTFAALVFARRAIVSSNITAAIGAAAFVLLAVQSSASAAAVPLLILVYDAWVLRQPGWRGRAARIYLPATAAVAVLVARRIPAVLAAERVPARSLIENLLSESIVVWRYLWLLAGSTGYALVHQVRWVTTPFDPVGVVALALLAACAAAAIYARRSMPLLAFGVVWFLAVLAPTSSVVPVRDGMAEHRAYLASAGLLLAAASLAPRSFRGRRAAAAVAVVMLMVLGWRTYQRNQVWADPAALWQESIRRSPGAWQAHLGYARLFAEIDRCDRARAEFETVLRLYPNQPDAVEGLEQCR